MQSISMKPFHKIVEAYNISVAAYQKRKKYYINIKGNNTLLDQIYILIERKNKHLQNIPMKIDMNVLILNFDLFSGTKYTFFLLENFYGQDLIRIYVFSRNVIGRNSLNWKTIKDAQLYFLLKKKNVKIASWVKYDFSENQKKAYSAYFLSIYPFKSRH